MRYNLINAFTLYILKFSSIFDQFELFYKVKIALGLLYVIDKLGDISFDPPFFREPNVFDKFLMIYS